jgi:hypothetical protein
MSTDLLNGVQAALALLPNTHLRHGPEARHRSDRRGWSRPVVERKFASSGAASHDVDSVQYAFFGGGVLGSLLSAAVYGAAGGRQRARSVMALMSVAFIVSSRAARFPATPVHVRVRGRIPRDLNTVLADARAGDLPSLMVGYHSLAPLGMAIVAIAGGAVVDNRGAPVLLAGLATILVLAVATWPRSKA